MENKDMVMLTTLFISLGLAACGSQKLILEKADANTQTTTTKTSTTSTTRIASC